MTDRRPLRDYRRSRAVLIGTSAYVQLPPVPAAANSLERMAGLLAGELCGWPADRISVFRNELGPGDLPDRLITLFEEAQDVALFYFVGHGQIDLDDQLCLGLAGSRDEPHRRAATSLQFHSVRRAMLDSPATTKILILDCCFAGLASRPSNTLGTPDYLLDKAAGTGAYTMAASSEYRTAWFETGQAKPQTYFTRYLADLVEAGIPGQPAGLRLRPLFTQLRESLARDHRPQPVDRSVDTASDFVFAHNAAPPETQVDHELELRRLRERLAAMQTEASARTRELDRLHDQARYSRLLTADQQEQLGMAMQEAGRRLDETTAAHATAEIRYRDAALAVEDQQSAADSYPMPSGFSMAKLRAAGPGHLYQGFLRGIGARPETGPGARSGVHGARNAGNANSAGKTRHDDPTRGPGPGRSPGHPAKRRSSVIAVLIASLVIILALGGGVYLYRYVEAKLHPPDFTGNGYGTVTVQVKPRATVTSLAPILLGKGVIASTAAFISAVMASSSPDGLQPGTFRLHRAMNAALAYQLLLSPKSRIQTTVTIPEGLRETQIVATLGRNTRFKPVAYSEVLRDPKALGLPSFAHGNPEGYLFPATYQIQPNMTAFQVLQGMVQQFNKEAQIINLAGAAAKAHVSESHAIIVASLIQAEGGKTSDFPKIAEVIYNRLNSGMKLQLDSTVFYALGTFGIQATSQDLKTNSPYNTYRQAGLPPTPIDSPGAAAIKAALHPEHGNWLYFVTVDPKKHITKFTASVTQFEQFRAELARNLANRT